MISPFSEYRVSGWRIRRLDSLARRTLSALAAADAAEARLNAIRDRRRPAVFDQGHYEDEVTRARAAVRDGAQRLAEWSVIGAAAAVPASLSASPSAAGGCTEGRDPRAGESIA